MPDCVSSRAWHHEKYANANDIGRSRGGVCSGCVIIVFRRRVAHHVAALLRQMISASEALVIASWRTYVHASSGVQHRRHHRRRLPVLDGRDICMGEAGVGSDRHCWRGVKRHIVGSCRRLSLAVWRGTARGEAQRLTCHVAARLCKRNKQSSSHVIMYVLVKRGVGRTSANGGVIKPGGVCSKHRQSRKWPLLLLAAQICIAAAVCMAYVIFAAAPCRMVKMKFCGGGG